MNSRPNIVLIMSDQHNAGVMGCAGNTFVKTPNIDRLAENGIRFTDANCPSPLCVPSRMSFMSSKYPSEIGVWSNDCVLASDIPTFAHGLAATGYETALCGRTHFRGIDQYHGFTKRIFGDCTQTKNIISPEILGSGFNRTTGQTKYSVEVAGYGQTGYQLYDKTLTDKACEYIIEKKKADQPFCLVTGFMLPHNPLICRNDLFEYYLHSLPIPDPVSESYVNGLHPAMKMWRKRRKVDELTAMQKHRALVAYYGLVSELDENIGKIVDTVKSSSQADNTVIIYCSDHGDMANEHGMWWKSSFYNGSVRVPLIISWPKKFHKNTTNDSVVNLLDIGPTLLDVAGAEPLPSVSGRNFADMLSIERQPSSWCNETFSEFIGLLGGQPACMVRKDEWKCIYHHEFQSYQLFNLNEDPEEMDDRANDPETKTIVEELLKKIRDNWNPEHIIRTMVQKTKAHQYIQTAENAQAPSFPILNVPESFNQFDFSQLN